MQSCKELGLCKDAELNFPRIDNTSGRLRLAGYYYGDFSGQSPDVPSVYLLYQNGVFLNRHSVDLEDAISDQVQLEYNELKKKYKGDWGVYKIENNIIEIHFWSPSYSCVSAIMLKGEISNDTTFKITSWQESDEKKNH